MLNKANIKNTKKKNGPAVLSAEDLEKTIGKGLSFGAAEAYKLLRINLSFSLPKTSNCQVIGVTSSLRGEGKSTTSINIAYTMAETGKKVLLIEADMRLPVMAKRLKIRHAPGLSNLLAGQSSGLEQQLTQRGFGVLPCCDLPGQRFQLSGGGFDCYPGAGGTPLQLGRAH